MKNPVASETPRNKNCYMYLSGVSGISQTSNPSPTTRRATTTSSYYFAGVSGTSQISCFSSITSSFSSMLLLTPLPMPTLPELPMSRRCLYGLLGTPRRLGLPDVVEP